MRGAPAVLLPLLLGAACDEPAPPAVPMRFLQANVGNVLLSCEERYVYKLCEIDVEERIRAAIASHAPDVVALQEVLPSSHCEGFVEEDPNRTCFADHRAEAPDQARRLVGDEFTIACDPRNGYECVAVRTSWGALRGCEDGAFCPGGAEVAPVVEGCDPGFSVGRAFVEPRGAAPFALVNAHPQSGFQYACRAAQMRQIFEGDDALVTDGPALVSGDMNLDPWKDQDESVRVWVEHVGDGARFSYHSDVAEKDPPYPTLDLGIDALDAVLDHVVSDFATGTCKTLGEHPGTERLDGGEGTDHRALLCDLELPGRAP